ncbi:cytochrome P450 [Suillus clintonianus]|uniref:cytochrome P450 n=1 Tax=Suillus clintonianus TaxID=1904413 RepID=UPI001B860475|nr:cytochrome P450 [Suillus clintonianus]KAG2112427.1 cytochrome P450 [Suillus clintonianus]
MPAAEGHVHKRQRRVATPAFSIQNMRALVPLVFSKGEELKDKWIDTIQEVKEDQAASDKQNSGRFGIDVCHWISRATFDVIGLAGFDHDFNAIQNESDELFAAYCPRLLSRREMGPIRGPRPSTDAKKLFASVAGKLEQQEKSRILDGEKSVKSNIATDLPPDQRISNEDILHNINTFMFAGSDTTSLALTWTFLLLARHPGLQTRLRTEPLSIVPTTPISRLSPEEIESLHNTLQNLPYLNNICRESLRLIPPVHSSLRVATQVDEIPVPYYVQIDKEFVRAVFSQLRCGSEDYEWDIYALAFEAALNTKSALKLSRTFLSTARDSLPHWAAHARLERLREHVDDARKVYQTVPVTSQHTHTQPFVGQLWWDWAEMEWLSGNENAALRVIQRSVKIEGTGGMVVLRVKRSLDDTISCAHEQWKDQEAWIKLRAFVELLTSSSQDAALTVLDSQPAASVNENPGRRESMMVASLMLLYNHSIAVDTYLDNSLVLGMFLELRKGTVSGVAYGLNSDKAQPMEAQEKRAFHGVSQKCGSQGGRNQSTFPGVPAALFNELGALTGLESLQVVQVGGSSIPDEREVVIGRSPRKVLASIGQGKTMSRFPPLHKDESNDGASGEVGYAKP